MLGCYWTFDVVKHAFLLTFSSPFAQVTPLYPGSIYIFLITLFQSLCLPHFLLTVSKKIFFCQLFLINMSFINHSIFLSFHSLGINYPLLVLINTDCLLESQVELFFKKYCCISLTPRGTDFFKLEWGSGIMRDFCLFVYFNFEVILICSQG